MKREWNDDVSVINTSLTLFFSAAGREELIFLVSDAV